MQETTTSFGALLRRLRSVAGLSQEALAERAGLSRNGIGNLERGLHPAPHLETVRLLADGLRLGDEERAALLAAARPDLLMTGLASSAPISLSPLPAPLTRLIGREEEVAALRAMLRDEDARLITVIGPGGVGKTRLALAVASESEMEFAAGAAFVPLAGISDAALVLPAIAQALGVLETRGRTLAEALRGALRNRHLLLVLDNFEHVLPATTDVVNLLASCPQLTIVVTSRASLRVGGEQRFPTPPLAVPACDDRSRAVVSGFGAIALFVERARAVRPDFALDSGNVDAVIEVCRRLDGLPLAIELAAAWVRILPLAALLERLERRLPLLRGGTEEQPVRLRTMRDAIGWSYDLISPAEQTLFCRLAVFVGGFTLEGAEAISYQLSATCSMEDEAIASTPPQALSLPQAPPGREGSLHRRGESPRLSPLPITHRPSPPSTLDLLASLLDKSLLRRSDVGGVTRFEMLETIREFGLERLAESGEGEAVAARHAAWCVKLAEEARRAGWLSQGGGLVNLKAEHSNLRAALAWLLEHGEGTLAQHLAGQLAEFWMRCGFWSEGQTWLEQALLADEGEATTARVEALVGLNMTLWGQDEFARAEQLLREAEAVARAVGDAGALAYVRLQQGYVASFQGDLDLALARAEEGLTTCAVIPQGFSCHGALWLLARVTLARGEDERAAALFARLLESARAGGDQISVANGHFGLALLAERRGELAHALVGFAEAAAVCGESDQVLFAGQAVDAAAAIAVALARPEGAVRLFAAAEAFRGAVGAAPGLGVQVDRQRHMQMLEEAREVVGEERFAAAWLAGSALSLNEALAEAMALAREVTGAAP